MQVRFTRYQNLKSGYSSLENPFKAYEELYPPKVQELAI